MPNPLTAGRPRRGEPPGQVTSYSPLISRGSVEVNPQQGDYQEYRQAFWVAPIDGVLNRDEAPSETCSLLRKGTALLIYSTKRISTKLVSPKKNRRSEANKEVSAIRRGRNCGIRSNFTNFLFVAQYITARSKSPKVPPGQHRLALSHENNLLWYNVVVIFDN